MCVIRTKDLRDQIVIDGAEEILYCSVCGSEYSANLGDYFMRDPDEVFVCCGKPMQLVTKKVVYTLIDKETFEPIEGGE